MILAGLGFVLPLAAGWCLVRALLPLRQAGPRWASLLLEGALGAGLGAGVASAGYFLLLLGGIASGGAALALDLALLAAGAGLLYARRDQGRQPAAPRPAAFRWNWPLLLALTVTLALLASALIAAASVVPYGEWDAWAIWSLRAKYLAGGSGAWRAAVSPALRASHPDYPLLLSGFVGMVWRIGGDTPQWTPMAASFLYLLCALALVAGAVGWMRGASSALLAVSVCAASSSYVFLAAAQYADLPLSFYYAATLALLAIASWEESLAGPARLLAGLFASLAAWTKNEGIPFAAAALLCFLAVEWRANGPRRAIRGGAMAALGSAPVLVLVACFKLFIAPAAEPLFAQGGAAIVHRAADGARYVQLGRSLALTLWQFGQPWTHPLALLGILAYALRFTREQRLRPALLTAGGTLAAVFLVYCGVYIVTPDDLAWRLGTSLSRLYAQLWPAFLVLVFLALRTAEETAFAPRQNAPGRKAAARPV